MFRAVLDSRLRGNDRYSLFKISNHPQGHAERLLAREKPGSLTMLTIKTLAALALSAAFAEYPIGVPQQR
jgi:hypothetical protein